jgi:hypothetical protein
MEEGMSQFSHGAELCEGWWVGGVVWVFFALSLPTQLMTTYFWICGVHKKKKCTYF